MTLLMLLHDGIASLWGIETRFPQQMIKRHLPKTPGLLDK